MPDGVQLPGGAHATIAEDALGRVEVSERSGELAPEVASQTAHERHDAEAVGRLQASRNSGRLCQQRARPTLVALCGGVRRFAGDPAGHPVGLARA